jgi:hypothetical protein
MIVSISHAFGSTMSQFQRPASSEVLTFAGHLSFPGVTEAVLLLPTRVDPQLKHVLSILAVPC